MIVSVTFDDQGVATELDGVPLEEDFDPRYEHSGMFKWTCPNGCGQTFTQGIQVIIKGRTQHFQGGGEMWGIPVCPNQAKVPQGEWPPEGAPCDFCAGGSHYGGPHPFTISFAPNP
jgi:hypothetical protein